MHHRKRSRSHSAATIAPALSDTIPDHHVSLSLDTLGDFDTLPERLQAEVVASKTVVPFVALVGAWSHKQANPASL
jgi:hypothetical protein